MASKDLVFRFLGVDGGAGREFDRMAGKSASLEKSIGKLGVAFTGAALAIGVESVRAAAKFQQSMELIHTQAGATQREVDKMSKAVLGLAGPTATAPNELAAGLYHLESAGFRGRKALDALRTAAEGAKIGGANLEDVTNALNATLVSGIKGAQNMSAAMGALNATVGAGDMRMQDLAEALGTGVLASVKGFGLSLNDVGAALATFGDNNIRGAEAATQLRMAVLFMAKPAASAKDTLKSLGMTSNELAKDMGKGGLGLALTDLHAHLVKAGDTGAKMGQALVSLFGHRAGTGIAVLEQQLGRFQLKQEEVRKGSRNFASDWTAYTQTFGYSWDRAKAAFESMTIQLGEKLLPTATKAMNWIGTTGVADLDKFGGWVSRNKTPIEDVAKALAGIAAFRFATSKLNDMSRLLGGGRGFGGGGLLGGMASKAEPVPVFVTNAGFGGAGGGLGAGEAAAGGAAAGRLGRLKGALGAAPGVVGTVVGAGGILNMESHAGPGAANKVLAFLTGAMGMGAQHGELGGSNKVLPFDPSIPTISRTTGKATAHGVAGITFLPTAKDVQDTTTNIATLNKYLVANVGLNKRDVDAVISEYRRIPGALKQVAAQAQAAGLTIGQMLDAGITVGIKQGQGSINLVSTQVIDGVRHTMSKRAQISSPSKMTTYLGQMLAAGLAFGMASGKKGVGQAASQMMDTIFGTVIGAGSLGNVASQTDSLGGHGGTSMADILAFTGGQVAQDKAFARNLARARGKGLSAATLQQIAQLGPDQGASIAASIAGATPAQIRRLNRDEASIGQYGKQISGVVTLSGKSINDLARAYAVAAAHHSSHVSVRELARHHGRRVVHLAS